MQRRTFVASSVGVLASIAGCTSGRSTDRENAITTTPSTEADQPTADKQITVVTEETDPIEESFIQANIVENESQISETETVYRYRDAEVQALAEVQSAVREAGENSDTFGGGSISSQEQMERVAGIDYVRYQDYIVRVSIVRLD
ncbi:hypothetical protein C499_12790 [Halogeometricum borinquense DSM 11551]|uniref:Uncharacterized protein n=1 Tax=Halogeometricum borinquense (strain ATCC 700274 / DSM 11551 / JCM 10706 / KCTC 4070 / PR3) TaxID=469382 RepID=E4NWN1_HALBP|nr:hypothetical protein [Halogeometricum borinquense]ADQ69451.1 hypothetical protein Hbor_37450 [Halogeometricum borinquense DSM 11551]ELY25759.1 hypothetical protein C499_12790 [Halogeometricum borinquense DSM 11551]